MKIEREGREREREREKILPTKQKGEPCQYTRPIKVYKFPVSFLCSWPINLFSLVNAENNKTTEIFSACLTSLVHLNSYFELQWCLVFSACLTCLHDLKTCLGLNQCLIACCWLLFGPELLRFPRDVKQPGLTK